MLPTPETIQRAVEIIRRIESLQSEVISQFGASTKASALERHGRPPGSGKRRKLNAEGRATIGAAAKGRRARFRAQE